MAAAGMRLSHFHLAHDGGSAGKAGQLRHEREREEETAHLEKQGKGLDADAVSLHVKRRDLKSPRNHLLTTTSGKDRGWAPAAGGQQEPGRGPVFVEVVAPRPAVGWSAAWPGRARARERPGDTGARHQALTRPGDGRNPRKRRSGQNVLKAILSFQPDDVRSTRCAPGTTRGGNALVEGGDTVEGPKYIEQRDRPEITREFESPMPAPVRHQQIASDEPLQDLRQERRGDGDLPGKVRKTRPGAVRQTREVNDDADCVIRCPGRGGSGQKGAPCESIAKGHAGGATRGRRVGRYGGRPSGAKLD